MGPRFPLAAAVVLALSASEAVAFNFVPTEAEFLAWPGYCKVAYARTTIGRQGTWHTMLSPQEVASTNRLFGDTTFGGVGVHHYCAGTTWLQRARLADDPNARTAALGHAERETTFPLTGVTPEHWMFAPVLVLMGTIKYERGQVDQALEMFEQVISASPTSPMPYTAVALIHRDNGRLDLAKKVLLQGERAVDGQSAELSYNLGLILVEMNELDLAEKYARKAYRLGYPLPGLRGQLQRLGHWDE